ncbi:hypothetical protein Tco_1205634 [Tanacetum coccineum]
MFDTMGVAINGLRTRIDKTLLEDRQRRWMSDTQNSLREFYKTDVILMSTSLSKNLKELKEEVIEEIDRLLEVSLTSEIQNCMLVSVEKQNNELLKVELEKSSSDSKDIQANLLERIKKFENDFKRSQAQSVESSNSVRRPKSKDTKSKDRVLKNNNDKRPSAHVQKMSSSVSIDSNKRETMHSNVCQSNASVLSTKTVNAVNDGSNIVCVSCGKDVFLLSHEKCVARYALSRNSSVKRALFTTPIAAKSKNLGATSVVAKSRLSIAKTPTTTNKVSSVLPLSPDSSQSRTLSNYMKNKIATSRKWQKWFENQQCFNWTPKSKTAQSLPSETKSRIRVRSTSNTPVTTQKWVAKLSTLPSAFVSCDAGDPAVLWIFDSGCSKHMTGNLKLLRNFVEKFIGTVRFRNDHFAAITGYGDYVQALDIIYAKARKLTLPIIGSKHLIWYGYCINLKKTDKTQTNTDMGTEEHTKSRENAIKSGQLKSTFGQPKFYHGSQTKGKYKLKDRMVNSRNKVHLGRVYTSPSNLIGQYRTHVDSEESTREWIICSNSLTKQAHKCHITDCHVGNPYAHTCDLTVDREYPMIRFNLRAKKRESV